MRLEHIRARAFGRLEAFDTGDAPLTDITVVVGPNESGKTTFFHMLGSIIYGLYPASRDQHPYAPWSGRDLDVEADLRLDDDQRWLVRRRLLASPTGHLTRGDHEEPLRNDTLPCARHVVRGVFHQVFALTQAEVATLESQAWSDIQDRLIGAMGARDIVPARSVADVLELEARGLWRPDRRGKQEIRELRKRIHGAAARRRQATETDRLLRTSMNELERTRHDLTAAKGVREQQRLLIEHTTTLLPAKKLLDRAAELEAEAGPSEDLLGLPPDPLAVHDQLVAEIAKLRARLARIREETAAPRERIAAFGSTEELVLQTRTDIEGVATDVAGLRPARTRLGALEREIRDRRRRADSALGEIFSRDLTECEEAALRRIVPRELNERVGALASARTRQREREMRSTLWKKPRRPAATALLAGVGSGAAAAALWLTGTDGSWQRAAGAFLALVASLLLGRWWAMREALARAQGGSDSEARDHPGAPDGDVDGQGTVTSAVGDLRKILGDLPVRDDVLGDAVGGLGPAVVRVQERLDDLDVLRDEAQSLTEDCALVHERIVTIGQRLAIDLPTDDAVAVHVLEGKLRSADRAEDARQSAQRELGSLERAQRELMDEVDERARELERLEGIGRRLGGGEVTAGLTAAGLRQRARERAEQIRDDLMRAHPDLEELSERFDQLAGPDGRPMGDAELAAARLALQEQSEHIEELTGRMKELEHECKQAEEQITVDQVDGEIEALEVDLRRLQAEHDRKLLLAHLIRDADRRFREEHQPDVVRRASEYLANITSGRYERITVGDEGDFYVGGADVDGPVEASSLSTGTREQLYLAIRLAVMGHLDEGKERLPAFVDETFVNWDAPRRARGFELLRELSRTRQVFVLTCHAAWADELVERGARRIDLPGLP